MQQSPQSVLEPKHHAEFSNLRGAAGIRKPIIRGLNNLGMDHTPPTIIFRPSRMITFGAQAAPGSARQFRFVPWGSRPNFASTPSSKASPAANKLLATRAAN